MKNDTINRKINLYNIIINSLYYLQFIAIGILLVMSVLVMTGMLDNQSIEFTIPLHPSNISMKAQNLFEQDGFEFLSYGNGNISANISMVSAKRVAIFRYSQLTLWLGVSLFITFLLKKVMATLKQGNPFVQLNVRSIRNIGKVIMWVGPLKFVLYQIEVSVYHLRFIPLSIGRSTMDIITYGVVALFIGYAIIVLAEVFEEGNKIKEEQKLTI